MLKAVSTLYLIKFYLTAAQSLKSDKQTFYVQASYFHLHVLVSQKHYEFGLFLLIYLRETVQVITVKIKCHMQSYAKLWTPPSAHFFRSPERLWDSYHFLSWYLETTSEISYLKITKLLSWNNELIILLSQDKSYLGIKS